MLKLPFLFFFIRIFGRRKSALPKYDPPGYAKRQVSILPIFLLLVSSKDKTNLCSAKASLFFKTTITMF